MGIAETMRTIALSSTKAEYMAILQAVKETVHIIGFLKELGHPELTDCNL